MNRYWKIITVALASLFLASCAGNPPEVTRSGKIEVQWLGNAAMKITTVSGKVILIDPFLSANPKTPAQYKNLDALGKIDLVLVTHGHGDHIGVNGDKEFDSIVLSKKHNAPLYGPAGMNQALITMGLLSPALSQRFGKGGSFTPFPGVRITATHAEHSSELLVVNAAGKGESHIGGEPVGFIIELENGFRIYHMGDTGLFGDMRMIGEYYRPDLIMIPIGGHYVMDPKDAAYATTALIKPKFAMPMHYATNQYLKGTPEEYITAVGTFPTRIININPGDKVSF